jgi:LacI family transcriptional regulator
MVPSALHFFEISKRFGYPAHYHWNWGSQEQKHQNKDRLLVFNAAVQKPTALQCSSLKQPLESALGECFSLVMNLRELSTLLNLSQTTVSRALNGFPEVNETTRARVKAAADLHGYRPSAAARRLATGQSGTLGVVFPRERNLLGDLIFTEFLGGCVDQASELGYDVTLAMARGQITEEAVYRRAVRSARVDAMILSSPLIEDPRIDLLREINMPFILHGRTRSENEYPFLDIDNEGAFLKATKLLTDFGHRRIALLNGVGGFNFAQDRERGFRTALEKAGIAPQDNLITGHFMIEDHGLKEAARLLSLSAEQRPTAFLCSSLAQAQGVQKIAASKGLRIGKDISVIAHDDRLQEIHAETFETPLTTTQSSIGDAGKRVVELMINMLRDPAAPLPQEVWPVDLVVRGSTGPAPN